jgi:hypothetical protein
MAEHKAVRLLVLQVSAWSRHTTSGLTEVWLDNQGHTYIADSPQGLITMLRMHLDALAQPQQQLPEAAATAAAPEAADPGKADVDNPAEATSTDEVDKAANSDAVPLWRRCCCCCTA